MTHNVDTPEITIEEMVEMLRAAGFRRLTIRKLVTVKGTIDQGVEVQSIGFMLSTEFNAISTIFAGMPVRIQTNSNAEVVYVDPI